MDQIGFNGGERYFPPTLLRGRAGVRHEFRNPHHLLTSVWRAGRVSARGIRAAISAPESAPAGTRADNPNAMPMPKNALHYAPARAHTGAASSAWSLRAAR